MILFAGFIVDNREPFNLQLVKIAFQLPYLASYFQSFRWNPHLLFPSISDHIPHPVSVTGFYSLPNLLLYRMREAARPPVLYCIKRGRTVAPLCIIERGALRSCGHIPRIGHVCASVLILSRPIVMFKLVSLVVSRSDRILQAA